MTKRDAFEIGTLCALPVVAFLYWLFFPPQCPNGYTQAQVDASHCIIGANIGGVPMFIFFSALAWWLAVWLVGKIGNKRNAK